MATTLSCFRDTTSPCPQPAPDGPLGLLPLQHQQGATAQALQPRLSSPPWMELGIASPMPTELKFQTSLTQPWRVPACRHPGPTSWRGLEGQKYSTWGTRSNAPQAQKSAIFLVLFCSGIIGPNAGHDPQEGCGAYPGRQHRAPCVTPLVFESAWVGVGHLPSPGELPPKKIWFPLTDFGWFWDGYWVRTPRPPPGWSSPACPPRPITPAEPVYFGCRAAACPLPFHRLSAGGGVPSGGLPAPNEVCAVQQGGGWFLAGVSLWFLDSGEIQGSIWVSR